MKRTLQVNESNLCLLQQIKKMRYVLNGPLKECRTKRSIDKTRTKLTETTLITRTRIHTNKTKHQNKVL